MAGKKQYHQGERVIAYAVYLLLPTNFHNTLHTIIGHDIKSLAINFATFLVFMLPFALYFGEEDKAKQYIGVVVGFLLLSLIAPPVGWKRPHPYTDMPGNEPFRLRKEN